MGSRGTMLPGMVCLSRSSLVRICRTRHLPELGCMPPNTTVARLAVTHVVPASTEQTLLTHPEYARALFCAGWHERTQLRRLAYVGTGPGRDAGYYYCGVHRQNTSTSAAQWRALARVRACVCVLCAGGRHRIFAHAGEKGEFTNATSSRYLS